MPILRSAIVDEARSFLTPTTKWVHQGRQKGVGVDCAGLLTVTARAVGASTFDIRDYEQKPNGTLLAIMRREMIEIPISTMQPGDAVAIAHKGEPMHVGIIIPYRIAAEHLAIIHASRQRGKVCEHRLDANLRGAIVAAFRFPGVEADS